MFCKARGWGVTFLKGSKRGDVPTVEGGLRFFKGFKRGGQKNPVNRNENLQTPPPPLLIKIIRPLNHYVKNIRVPYFKVFARKDILKLKSRILNELML